MHNAASAYRKTFAKAGTSDDVLRALLIKGIKMLTESVETPKDATLLRKALQYNNDMWLFLNDSALDVNNDMEQPAREWISRSADLSNIIGNRIMENALEPTFLSDLISLNRILLDRVKA